MEALKSNFEKALLALLAVALLASSILLVLRSNRFERSFGDIRAEAPRNETVDEIETGKVAQAFEMAKSPQTWTSQRPLFVSEPVIPQDGALVFLKDEGGVQIHPPVPNKWFLENGLDLLDTVILSRDKDDDGFDNLEEWEGGTDPKSAEDHPPYYTKLRLEEFIQKDFRLIFASYSGDTFQINTIDLNQPSQFLRLGDQIRGTEYVITRFEEKFEVNPQTGGQENVSVLTVRNEETGKEIALQLEQIVNDPDALAKLRDLWADETLQVKKDEDFVLKATPEISYKLLSVDPQQATIKQNESGKVITIPKLQP